MKINLKKGVSLCLILLFIWVQGIGVFAHDYQNTSYNTLKYGSKGNSVAKLQNILISKGYLKDAADGIFGLMTEKAVIKFQISNRLRIDGIAGKQTQSTLYSKPISRGTSTAKAQYNATDLYWLSRIIHAEAGAEPYKGKVAVGNVILNRVSSKSFPNTIKGVIFEYYQGIPQFSPVAEGTIYKAPSQESIQAAKDALNGTCPVGKATYFFAPNKSEGKWIVRNKSFLTKIGNHVFYQ